MDLYNLVLSAKLSKGGGSEPVIESLSVTENGTYTAPSGVDGYSPVTVNVPGITPSGTYSITSNGIYDIVSFASVDVNVSGGGGGDHDAEDGLITRAISGAYENSRVTSIGSYAFDNCTSLTTASFPNVTLIGGNAFSGCTRLTTVSFPNAALISGSAFYNCTSLTTANFPNVASISGNAFRSCTSLTTASFPNVKSINGGYVFNGCTRLKSFYILASSVAGLADTNVFANTPMSTSSYLGYFGSIYVPASLVDSYKSARYWSAYADRITSYVE